MNISHYILLISTLGALSLIGYAGKYLNGGEMVDITIPQMFVFFFGSLSTYLFIKTMNKINMLEKNTNALKQENVL